METLVNNVINWKRISASLWQSSGKIASTSQINEVIDKLKCLYPIMGLYSQNRSMLSLIGKILLGDRHHVYVPVCPDYSHLNELYTMKSVSNGISLVSKKHIDFLLQIKEIIPSLNVTFLTADQECYDSTLCIKMKLSTNEFRSRIIESNRVLNSFVKEFNWCAEEMTKIIPDILLKESEYSSLIESSVEFSRQIDYDTIKRDDLYKKIDHMLSWEDKRKRTIRTAAQYYTLGQFSFEKESLICNHTTTNLAWYLKTGVALIENPVVIY